jgi:hypothetical protein
MLRNQFQNFPINNENLILNSTRDKNLINITDKENNPFSESITPFYKQKEIRKSFYSRVNTSPIKIRNIQNEDHHFFSECETTADKTIKRDEKFSELNETYNNFLKFDGKENDFFSPNLNSIFTTKTNRFTSNSNARNLVKQLISEGKISESKPSLSMIESRNNLIAFSKTKKYENEINEQKERESEKAKAEAKEKEKKETKLEKYAKKEDMDNLSKSKQETSSIRENSLSDEIKEDSEEDTFENKIKRQIANLPVPIEKKDDEGFKLLKMKELKKKSLPPNKSARAYDSDLLPTHQKDMINGNYISILYKIFILIEYDYSLCKKRKTIHSAKKVYKSILSFSNPRDLSEVHRFPLYRDNDVGINEYWQTHLIESVK